MTLEPQAQLSDLVSSRARVAAALRHEDPDRVPTDFLATPEIWDRLTDELHPDTSAIPRTGYFSSEREAILRHFQVDCRLISYDMFVHPPESILHKSASVDWWGSLARSTPGRMWRQRNQDGSWNDVWGIHTRRVENASGAYEELVANPLKHVTSVEELKGYLWPEPDWWDFSPLPELLRTVDPHEEYHWRYRIGSVFETAWQLRGMQEFLTDLGTDPAIPLYIMDRLVEVHTENIRRLLELVGDRLDMVYFYDDVATQNSLMMSKPMWRRIIRPRHEQIIEPARARGKPLMYHCDGAVHSLIPELLDMGVNVLSPIQPNAQGMALQELEDEFGSRLTFHGGIDIVETLPRCTPEEVAGEVRDRVTVLGKDGGYILCSSHHIQPDTPLSNIIAMYDLALRYR